jgi:aspartyl-tRNA(Asn)/glutamyl-tRNA(Gln) amidotransferase subunit B
MSEYVTFVGLEIHIHLKTETKMFCGCQAHFGDEPNSNVCPVCMGWPGTLPRVNERAMEMGYLVSRALNCELSPRTLFARKNYFYPDMPKNYQISQFKDPVGLKGSIEFPLSSGGTKKARIHDCHLEEDAGKMIHAGDLTLLDYNRAGVPLLEVVTEPDLSSGEEAEDFLRYFQRLVRYLGVCDGNMEEGSLRCDANVSINLSGRGLGSKVEIKNLNSSRFVRLALEYERGRQAAVLDSGERVVQETRLWNENRDMTAAMRSKENSHDYRYFPEPDLPPFVPDAAFLGRVDSRMVESPLSRKERLKAEYGLSGDAAEAMHETRGLADYFEEAVQLSMAGSPSAFASKGEAALQVASWIAGDLKKECRRRETQVEDSRMTSARLANLARHIASGRISCKIAKKLIGLVLDRDAEPEAIMASDGLELISSREALLEVARKVIGDNPSVVELVRSGDESKKEYLIGRAMEETSGRASPQVLRALMDELL